MTGNKTQPTKASVDTFLSDIENLRRRKDALVSLDIYKKVTGLTPVMWGPSIVGFGSYEYEYESGRRGVMLAAGFSPRKANLSFYVDGKFEGAEALFDKLGKHKRSVACLYINKLEDVDLNVLTEIIKRDYMVTSGK